MLRYLVVLVWINIFYTLCSVHLADQACTSMEGNNNKAPFTGVDTEKASCSSHGDESNIEMQDPTSAAMAETEDPDQHPGCFPVLFRRSKFFPFNPRFDSPHLEEYMESCFFPQSRQKFKSAIAYVIFSCILWVIYFSLTGPKRMPDGWLSHTVGTASMLVISVAYLVLTFFPVFSRHPTVISFTYGLLLATASLLRYAYVEKTRPANFAMTPLGAFSSLAEVVLMMYTLLPLPLYLCSSLAIAYSTLFEILFSVKSEVITVRDSVCVIARSTVAPIVACWRSLTFSRMRSKITIVSLIE